MSNKDNKYDLILKILKSLKRKKRKHMGLITYPKTEIRVPISNDVSGGTIMMRKVLLTKMTELLPNGNQPTGVRLDLVIEHYAVGPNDENGNPTYGDRMINKFPGIDRFHSIEASSATLVDNATGAPLCEYSEYQRYLDVKKDNPDLDVDLPPALLNEDGTEKDFIREDEFFLRISENLPVIVRNLEKQYIQSASARGKFNF